MTEHTNDNLVSRRVECPCCAEGFTLWTPKSHTSQLISRDSDFCPRYEGINPLLYAVWVCPQCTFAAYKDDFRQIKENEEDACKRLADEQRRAKRHDFATPERSLFAGLLSYQLAHAFYQVRKSPPHILAGIQLRLAWLCRFGNDRKRELSHMRMALEGYLEAYDKGLPRNAQMSDAQLTYLVADLHRRLGKGEDAVRFYLQAIKADATQGEVSRLARTGLYEAKESIRFFQYLQGVDVLKPLEIDEIAELAAQIRSRVVQPGQTLVRKGEPGDSMFIVIKGKIEILLDDEAPPVAMLGSGDFVGEMSLLKGEPRTAHIRATEETEVLEIDKISFRTVLKANPAIAGEISRVVSERREENARFLEAIVAPEPQPEPAHVSPSGRETFLSRLVSYFEL